MQHSECDFGSLHLRMLLSSIGQALFYIGQDLIEQSGVAESIVIQVDAGGHGQSHSCASTHARNARKLVI